VAVKAITQRGRTRFPGFLMMNHMAPATKLAEHAKLMESYGAHCIYVTDSGGRLTMHGVRERIRAYRDVLDPQTQIGIHAHENLSLSVANSVVAVEEGVTRVAASLAGHGAGAGNCPIEPFIAVANIHHWKHRCDSVRPPRRRRRPRPPAPGPARPRRPRNPHPRLRRRLLQLPAPRRGSAKHYGIDVRTILLEVGKRQLVGGQEDMIVDIALDLAGTKD
jgi:4-hydroxy 2-oxovalerate aldolase